MRKLYRAPRFLFVSLCILLLTSGLFAQATPPQQATQTPPARTDAHVIMISIDGLVPDYYTEPAKLGLKVPNLVKLKLGGAFATGVEGIYPSVTYPAHTTLVTGVRPATHGIIQNRIFEAPTDEQTREWYWFTKDLKSETLWTLAKKAGLVTAGVGWPVTVGAAEIDYNMPEIADPKERSSPKRTLQYSTPGLLTSALGMGGGDTTTDGRRAKVAEYIIEKYKPNLMLIHFIALDGVHHEKGPRTPDAIAMAERMDDYIGRVVEATRRAGIFEKTTFFIVSDHGFAEVKKRFEPNVLLVKEKLITLDESGKPTDWKAAAWPAGGSCAIVLRDPADKATATKVASIFTQMASRNNSPVGRVLERKDIDRLGSIPNAFLMLDAAPGFAFGEDLKGEEINEPKDYRGTHGHLPTRAELRSSLIIFGPGARVGAQMPLARMIDIAPTAAALLGLTFSDAEGQPIRELIKPGLIPKPQATKKKSKGARDSGSR
ncbi:MAG TPA: alkaline phosphatase family protein [Blastocatellia bacterium]|nr:alkaline phosphatase family protein [Blastocatellia bacterium]